MDALLELVRESPGWPALMAILFGAALEYLFPPFPGDTVVLAGSLLVLAGQYSFFSVFLVASVGGLAGAGLHYYLGTLLRRRGMPRWAERFLGQGSLERAFATFERWGLWVIAFNRALPGVRAVVFLAAGSARLPLVPTFLLGLGSNLAWTFGLLSLGTWVGGSWEKILEAYDVYGVVFYWVAGAFLVAYLVTIVVGRQKGVRK